MEKESGRIVWNTRKQGTYMKKWIAHMKKADFDEIGRQFNIDPVIARIIRNRGIQNIGDIDIYLNGSLDCMYSAWLMKDMEKAVDILQNKIKSGKSIRIIGDYDIDGVCSTYILYRGFERLGAKVDFCIPERVRDGYGLNERLVEEAFEDEIDTIVTCDNGIAAKQQIAFAKDKKMTVIVTDHHDIPFEDRDGQRQYILPDADAIVNPKQPDCKYPFKGLCGAAVAWKVIIALFEKNNISDEAYDFLEFAAIATIGDVMDLSDENRIITKEGLKKLTDTQQPGLRALIDVNELTGTVLQSHHIGFRLGPCLNASGRLDTAKRAVNLLLAKTKEEADVAAWDLKEFNENRKELTLKWSNQAFELIENTDLKNHKVLLVRLPDCHESIAGIIAGRIREKYYKPVLVFTNSEDGLKASGRSIESYNMFEELSKFKHLFTKFGGHPMAAGLSMPEENFYLLQKSLNEECTLDEEDFMEKIYIDVPMPIHCITEKIIEEMSLLEPFGKGNPKPLFAQQHLGILSIRRIGKNQDMLKLLISDGFCKMDALLFDGAEDFITYLENEYGAGQVKLAFSNRENNIDIGFVYIPQINEFRGLRKIQINIIDYCHIIS